MADVFISYAHEDRQKAEQVALFLQEQHYSVWWDRAILAGSKFDREIERQLKNALAVVVLWSKHSADSDWVRAEADAGLERGVLVPVLLDTASLPILHRLTQAVDFVGWNGSPEALNVSELLSAVRYHRTSAFTSFLSAAKDRLVGRVWVADKLADIAETNAQWSEFAMLELAYHEYARLGDKKSLPMLEQVASRISHPFALRAMKLLLSVCYLAAGALAKVVEQVQELSSDTVLSDKQKVAIALHEILVFGALDDVPHIESAWEALVQHTGQSSAPEESYPCSELTRQFDRALLSVIYGTQDVSTIVAELPLKEWRGLIHIMCSNARAVRKSPYILEAVERRGTRKGWQAQCTASEMRKRCRDFELMTMPNAGTLFSGTVKRKINAQSP